MRRHNDIAHQTNNQKTETLAMSQFTTNTVCGPLNDNNHGIWLQMEQSWYL